MSKTLVKTVIGKYYEIEIWRETPLFGSTKFYVWNPERRKGRGSFSSLADAVDAAEEMAG